MKYSCDHCPYESDKKANYFRHLNRKFRCDKKIALDCDNIALDCDNIALGDKNVALGDKNITPDHNINVQDHKQCVCSKCNKRFVSQRNLKIHKELYCKGIDILKCEICLKSFASYNGKYKHKRDVLCYPPPPPPPPDRELSENHNNNLIPKDDSCISTIQTPVSLTNNTNHSHNNNQITTNSNNNTVNNIIHYNAFGDEGIEQLGKFLLGQKDDSKIIERMKQIGKKKLYGVREMQNDIFFNPANPEGFSIIKTEKYGSRVRVRNSDGEFEYMEFSDVRDPLFNYMEKYVDIYNQTRNKYNVKFRDPRERRILQDFFKIMNDDLDIYLGEDLKEDLNIQDEESSSPDEEDEGKKYKQFDRVSLDNLHTQTKKFYKCKKGEFVRKK